MKSRIPVAFFVSLTLISSCLLGCGDSKFKAAAEKACENEVSLVWVSDSKEGCVETLLKTVESTYGDDEKKANEMLECVEKAKDKDEGIACMKICAS